MSFKQERPAGCALASKPSTAFSTASATSAASSRSGGSKLLFGEIDLSSDRSTDSYASVCSFVLCDSSTFLRFWLEDTCRERLLSYLPRSDLASLRLACHDFSVRAAPALFADLKISFKANSFTKPARVAALDRLGFYVRSLTFEMAHTADTFLPPLVDPRTGGERAFTYTPSLEPSTASRPKYGDIETTELLTRQWPSLFHAATNVPAFIRIFSNFVNLAHLTVSCPGYDASSRHRRSIVEYALISLRIAIERNSLNALDKLTLSPIPLSGLFYLSPVLGYGATPRSLSRWSRIRTLTIHADASLSSVNDDYDNQKLLQTYLTSFQSKLTTFNFRWNSNRGPFPLRQLPVPTYDTHECSSNNHPTIKPILPDSTHGSSVQTHFPCLLRAEFLNIHAPAKEISHFVDRHKKTVIELNFDETRLSSGTWDDALAPLIKIAKKPRLTSSRPPTTMLSAKAKLAPNPPQNPSQHLIPDPNSPRHSESYFAEIPIMLSPSTRSKAFPLPTFFPTPMHRVELPSRDTQTRNNGTCVSRWLGSRRKGNTIAPTPTSEQFRFNHQPVYYPANKQSREKHVNFVEGYGRRTLKETMFGWF